ncbi:hypothetical protein DACRYDRAFT_113046 [Dacryopinax primogenitus]|uniref:20S-pre-rRNA D-site endonuclease NOB1 n=1 Tax=Dacryopinax primogenitus (strain DJM 731) TaxID=1858805 RepID=M5GCN6_DACPD|nr:uncharacterized protein DACRYDRAFT_113046 [Dacryopinax primogenitus]EJU06325.1 hypothetical protein DACRYDRAFT_113046 [Dacryopinax primogenitus]
MTTPANASTSKPRIKHLVLDAGPLLTFTPLRGLAENYYTTPQIVEELKDPRAREHFQNLSLTAGVHLQVRQPDILSVSQVTITAKKTGDYAVLSQADVGVIALTHELATEETTNNAIESQILSNECGLHGAENVGVLAEDDGPQNADEANSGASSEEEEEDEENTDDALEGTEDIQGQMENLHIEGETSRRTKPESSDPLPSDDAPAPTVVDVDDPPSDDGEGEWITPSNVDSYKSRAREPNASGTKADNRPMIVACMTADYAVQNVLMHMHLNLVTMEGKRITKVKSWVLRCHACFKICKDPTKKFCPSCGNPTLLRTSVSTEAPSPGSPNQEPIFRVHLKPNFQYRTRGTIYSIPLPKLGQAKGGGTGGSGLILREDQIEYQRALHKEKGRQAKEERAMERAMAAAAKGERPRGQGTWDDPDWIPGLLLGEAGRKRGGGMPAVGHGRRNPNEARRKKR